MADIVILCEGDTEELAVRYFLHRQWATDGLARVGLRRVNLRGRLQDVGVKTRLFLDEPEVLGVFTLIDLYGMDRVQHGSQDSLETKVDRVQRWLREQVSHPRSDVFFPHVSVHETEAWILAEGAALAKRLHDQTVRPDPEAETTDFQRPPSKRVNELFLSRRSQDRYHKILDGRPLFSDLQFATVYHSCRYFRAFYDDLKRVASASAV